jgi:hypothetical protein
MRRIISASCATLVLVAPARAEDRPQWGDLRGRIVVVGNIAPPATLQIAKKPAGIPPPIDESLLVDKQGGVKNVLVYLRTKDPRIHPDYAKVADTSASLAIRNLRFESRVVPLDRSQSLGISNFDPLDVNVQMSPIGDQDINVILKPNRTLEHRFTKSQTIPQPVTCGTHPWMKAYVIPRDNPYFAVTAVDGSFEIKNLPAGELEFQFWHERAGYLEREGWPKGRAKVTIKPGGADLGVIRLPASVFER